jgi:hypothetical protein
MKRKIEKKLSTVSFHLPRQGLPDGVFSRQKSQFGYILEGLGNKIVSFMPIWNIYGHLVRVLCGCFFPFWYVLSRKIWQP